MLSSSEANVRKICLDVLERLDDGCPIQAALAEAKNRFSLERRDRQLLTELCYGVLRTELRLTSILETFLSRLDRLPRRFLFILYIALYSRLFLDRIPPHAVFSTAVSLAKDLYGKQLAGVATAVLRAFEEKKSFYLSPAAYLRSAEPKEEQHLHALARFYALPFWLLNFWQQQYGLAQALFFAKRSFVRPRVGIVLSAEHPRSEELRLQLLSAQTEYGSRIERIGSHGFAFESHVFQTFFEGRDAMSLHAQGLFSFQSAGSQAVVHGLGLTLWRKPVWDMCAGFGGKSALLAHYGVALSLCTDTSHTRLKGLRSDFARRGLPIPSCLLSDAITPPLTRFHGHILLDTPCSGLGILSRRPDLRRARKNKRSLRLFPRQQKALLASAYSCLERGCELAYITCTLSPAENEEQINAFLKEHPDLELLRVYRTPSDDLGYEGMFGALLRRF